MAPDPPPRLPGDVDWLCRLRRRGPVGSASRRAHDPLQVAEQQVPRCARREPCTRRHPSTFGGIDVTRVSQARRLLDSQSLPEFFEDTKQNNGSGTTCNEITNSGWLCVDYTGSFATISDGGSLTWTFTGTYTGDPVDVQHLMAQGCIDVTDTWETHGPNASSGNCPFNGAGSYNISLDGTGTPPVPEPGSLMLFGTGLLGMAGFLRRKLFA